MRTSTATPSSPLPRAVLAVVAVVLAAALLAACDEAGGDGGGDDGGGDAVDAAAESTPEGAEGDLTAEGTPSAVADEEWRLVLEEPLEKPDLVLTDQDGEEYDLRAETEGTATLVFFGFTHCPDFCPAHLAVLSGAMAELPNAITDDVEVVFVSVDPDRDPPERLREYLAGFDETFVGLHGDLEEVNRAHRELNLPEPVFEEPDEEGNYYVSHAAAIVAFHPDDDRARTMYPFGIRRQHWVQELPRLAAGEEFGN